MFTPVKILSKRKRPKIIRDALTKKKKYWKKWRDTGSSCYKEIYDQYAEKYKSNVAKCDSNYVNKICDLNNTGLFYRFMRKSLSLNFKIPPIKDDLGILQTQTKAAIFANKFSGNFTHHHDNSIPDCSGPPNHDELLYFSENNILRAISSLSSSTSCGPDDIPTLFVKNASCGLTLPLSIIFNHCFINSTFPTQWKTSRITPVFKKGCPTDPDNYRPVSITSPFPKIMEKILNEPLLNFLMKSDLFYDGQFGFLPGRSTTTNMLCSMDVYTKALEDALPLDAIYIDFSRAFDKVHHGTLCQQLLRIHIPPIFIRFITSFISGRTQYVSLEGANSMSSHVHSGVIQGTILSATLFTIFVNSLPSHTLSSKLLMFADDIKLLPVLQTFNPTTTQADLNVVAEWSTINHLPISTSKSVAMHLGKNNTKHKYHIMNDSLKATSHVKDLGISYDSTLSFSAHISNIVTRSHRLSYMIRHCLGKADNMSKVRAFTIYVMPILEYGSPVWSPDLIKDIKLIENVLKKFTKSLHGMYNMCYKSRLETLGLTSLERRRLIIDLCLAYKIIHKITYIPGDYSLIEILPASLTRRHDLQIRSSTVKCKKRFNFFTFRIARVWNNLPDQIVYAPTLQSFKTLIQEADLSPFLKVYTF